MFDMMVGVFGSAGAGLLEKLLHPSGAASIGDLAYFVLIYDFLHSEIEHFGLNMSRSVTVTAGGIALVIMTIWVFFQGLRFVTGQNRESFMAFLMNSMRALLIVSAAMTFATTNSAIYNFLTEDLQGAITAAVTGEDGDDPKSMIDKNLAYMQLGLSSIDVLQISDDPNLYQEKSRDMWLVGVGTAGPAMVGGAMLLMYEVAWALFIGLGPIFILCLLFDATKSLFQKWLLYGIGTMFSMAVLAAMIAIATKTVLAVAEAFWASSLIGSILGTNFNDGMNSMALQQGGIGLLLTVLLITTPPMVSNFFSGTLGNFAPVASITGSHAMAGGGGGYRGGGGHGGYRGGGTGGWGDASSGAGSNPSLSAPPSRSVGAGGGGLPPASRYTGAPEAAPASSGTRGLASQNRAPNAEPPVA